MYRAAKKEYTADHAAKNNVAATESTTDIEKPTILSDETGLAPFELPEPDEPDGELPEEPATMR
jgi:hypothetical protein